MMTGDTDTVTAAVAQIVFRRSTDGELLVVASSFDGEQQVRRWTASLAPYLGRIGVPALSYLTFSDGLAALVRCSGPAATNVHALLGPQAELTPTIAVTACMWPGWQAAPSADVPMRNLRAADLCSPDAAERLRAPMFDPDTDLADMLATTLAWLLQSPRAPLGLVGCPEEIRVPLLWCLFETALHPVAGSPLEATRARLASRAWSFSTGGDIDDTEPAAISFLDALPTRPGRADRIVVDLSERQSAAPRHVAEANALVYRYEFGVDPPPDPEDSPAFVPIGAVAGPHIRPGDIAPSADPRPPGRAGWFSPFVRDLVAAPDNGAFDKALADLEYAVAGRDDRDELRAALENEGWAADAIRRHVPFQALELTYDRVVRIAFGATGAGRETVAAHVDALHLAATSPSDELVRALARTPRAAELAPAIAQRWIRQHRPDANVGLGVAGRFLTRRRQLTTPGRELLVLGVLLLVAFALGVMVGAR